MNLVNPFKSDPIADARQLGSEDGELDQDHALDLAMELFGPPPAVRPDISLEDALRVEGADTTQLKEWITDLRATQLEIVKHFPAWLLMLFLIFVVIAEFETAMFFWRDAGVVGLPRIVMAIATAIVTVFFPWLVVELWHEWRDSK